MPGPHDSIFKWTFQQHEHAASELRTVLPEALVSQLDLEQLCVEDATFIDQELNATYSDLLYSVPLAGQPALVYVLFEHQSTVDWTMPLRLLEYLTRIWRKYLAEHPEARQLPFIIPVVLHHSPSGWTKSRSFRSLFDTALVVQSELARMLPDFEFALDDVSLASDEALLARAQSSAVRAVLWAMRDARAGRRLLEHMQAWASVLSDLRVRPTDLDALVRLLSYVFDVADEVTFDEFERSIIQTVGTETAGTMATIAEQLRREGEARGRQGGRQEGRQEGRLEGQRELLTKQIRSRFGDLPERLLARVNAASPEQLEHWAERILTAGSIEEVLDS